MSNVHGIRSLCAMVAAMTVGAASLSAQAPGAPSDLHGVLANCPTFGYVYLKWTDSPDGGKPNGFNIYQASGQTDDLSLFSKVASQSLFDNGDGSFKQGGYAIISVPVGTFSFYVTTVNDLGESGPSNIVTKTVRKLDIPFGTTLRDSIDITPGFISKDLQGSVGREVTLSFNTVNHSGKAMRFEMLLAPEGMTIDATSGLLRWQPKASGEYPFVVRAFYLHDPDVGTVYAASVTAQATTSAPSTDASRETSVSIYPNPAASIAFIEFPKVGSAGRLTMADALGRIVVDVELPAGATAYTLDTEHVPEGAYVVRMTGGDREATLPLHIVR